MRRKRIEGRYEVTDAGDVLSGGLPLRPVRGVWVSIGGRRRRVDWLVARAFVPNPEGRPCLAHLNGDVRDSRAVNLEWREEPQSWVRSGRKASPRPVGAWDRAGDSAGVWGGVVEAARATGLRASGIRSAADRKGSCGGLLWRWL